MSLASAIEHKRIPHDDPNCRCKECSYLQVVIMDPETCEPASGPGAPGDVDNTALLTEIRDLLIEIPAILGQTSADTELLRGQPVGGGTAFTVVATIDAGAITFADTTGASLVEGVDFERCADSQGIIDAIEALAACICCPPGGFSVADIDNAQATKWNINGTDTDAVDAVAAAWTPADLAASLNTSDPLGGTWAVNAAGDGVKLTSTDPGTYIHLKLISLIPVVTIPFGAVTA